jgi:hypothetical protein
MTLWSVLQVNLGFTAANLPFATPLTSLFRKPRPQSRMALDVGAEDHHPSAAAAAATAANLALPRAIYKRSPRPEDLESLYSTDREHGQDAPASLYTLDKTEVIHQLRTTRTDSNDEKSGGVGLGLLKGGPVERAIAIKLVPLSAEIATDNSDGKVKTGSSHGELQSPLERIDRYRA